MDYKKIKIKKSEATLFSLIMSMIIIIGIFIGLFFYVGYKANQQGIVIDNKYNITYQNYINATDDISSNIDKIATGAKSLKDAPFSWQTAWNGIVGLGALLKLPLNFVDTGSNLYESSSTQAEGIIPDWAFPLIWIGIIGLIVLIVVSVLKGDTNLIK